MSSFHISAFSIMNPEISKRWKGIGNLEVDWEIEKEITTDCKPKKSLESKQIDSTVLGRREQIFILCV